MEFKMEAMDQASANDDIFEPTHINADSQLNNSVDSSDEANQLKIDANYSRDRSRSQSYSSHRSDSRDYSRSRSPRTRTTATANTREKEAPTRNRDRDRDRSRERERDRDRDRGHRGGGGGYGRRGHQSSGSHQSPSDKELGLKYRWEKTIYVSNIPYDVKWPELKDLFRSKVGDIHFCEVFEKDGKSLGAGSIEFKSAADADRAVDVMNHYEMGGRKIAVRLDGEGYKTRKAKEMCRSDSHKASAAHSGGEGRDTAALLALNQAATLAALAGNVGGSGVLGLLTGGNSNMLMLNQLAQQLKVEGPVTNRIFVASLDYKVDEAKLKEVFGLAGKVASVSLFKERDGKSRGMAVLEFDSGLEALNAVAMFNNQVLNDRQMTVRFDTKPPRDEETSKSSSSSKLPSGLKSIGMGLGLGGLGALQAKKDNSLVAGLDALGAIANLNPSANNPDVNSLSAIAGLAGLGSASSLSTLLGNLGASASAGSETSRSNGNGNSSRSHSNISKVFIKNIPFSWDDRKMKEKFRQAGSIEYVEIKQRDGKSRGCGLIKFYTPSEAQKAVELFNGSRFEGRTLEVKLDLM